MHLHRLLRRLHRATTRARRRASGTRCTRRLKKDDGLLPRSVAGEREATWIVADYLDVVLHVFTPEARDFYRLDDLWGDVPQETPEAASA